MSKRTSKKKQWTRVDGRAFNQLRDVKIECGVLPNADGSAYIEMGRNKIICGVFGPREMHPKHVARPNEAVLKCRYHMAPFSVDPRRSPAPSRRDQEFTMVMRSAFEPAVFLERYPRAGIDVYVEVLQADGGTRCASINAASVALVDAGIPMKDLVSACATGKIDDKIILDLGDFEDKKGQSSRLTANNRRILPDLKSTCRHGVTETLSFSDSLCLHGLPMSAKRWAAWRCGLLRKATAKSIMVGGWHRDVRLRCSDRLQGPIDHSGEAVQLFMIERALPAP